MKIFVGCTVIPFGFRLVGCWFDAVLVLVNASGITLMSDVERMA